VIEMELRRVEPKTIAEIAHEWDRIADVRHTQLTSGADVSYDLVLRPTVLELADFGAASNVLDVGCGTGHLTTCIARRAQRTVALDPSSGSLEVAKRHGALDGVSTRVEWLPVSIEEYARAGGEKFEYIVANMALMDMPDITGAMAAIGAVSRPGTVFVGTITHPWFWPRYWGYESAAWFHYESEIFVEGEFRISRGGSGMLTTHVHRPLQRYFEELAANGFQMERVLEPMPTRKAMQLYRRRWLYPRFLAFRAVQTWNVTRPP